jgi:hypothetical protein
VFLKVNDSLPGDTLDAGAGSKLRITAEAYGHREQIPLTSLEIVGHGAVLQKSEGVNAEKLTATLEIPVDRGMWIAARCQAGKGQMAHTTPVYVTVGGGGFHNPVTAPKYLELSERYLNDLENDQRRSDQPSDARAKRRVTELERQIVEARSVLRRLAQELK